MDQEQRRTLLWEAEQQIRALRTIRKWLAIAIGLSTVGAAAAYWGFGLADGYAAVGVIGTIVAVLSLMCALLIIYGMRNGQRIVRKILQLAGEKA